MPDRYWVGGTASWDGTAGTKWATTSGGAGGASVPTSVDDVFFTNLSTGTCTISGGNTGARSINCTGFTGTLTGSANITINGSVTLSVGMTFTHTGTVTIADPATITSNGKSFGLLTFSGTGDVFDLADALTVSGAISLLAGTFNTNNFNVTASSLLSTTSNTRTINLGSSTVTLSINGTGINFSTNTGLSFNAGTSSIVLTGSSASIIPGVGLSSIAFNNISFTSTGANTHVISLAGTGASAVSANNFAVTAPSSAGVSQVTFGLPVTINGTLSTTGTAGNRRVWFRGATYGIAQTLTINSAPSLTDADFRDIYVIGTAAPISGTRIGDLRGCRGITFSTPKTVYWATAGGGSWSGNNWAATSGGSVNTDNFPLAQDTAVIGNTGLNTGATVTMDSAISYTGSVDMLGRTNAMTLSTGAYTIYGDWTNGVGTSIALNQIFTFSGRTTQTIISAGKFGPTTITIDSYGGTIQLADALNIGTNTLTVTNGTFNTQSYNVTAGSLSSSNSNVRAITLGSSTVTLSGASPVTFTTSTNLTLNAGTSQITCSGAGANFNGGGMTFNNVSLTTTSTNQVAITGANTFANLTATAPASAGLTPYALAANQTITGTLTCAGATAVRRIFLRSDTLGTTRTLTVNSLSADDCDFRDITIAGAAAGSSPTRAGDCGGSTGITFPAPKTVFWNLAGAQNWSSTGWATSSGGTPDINNFPLAQDTAVFDDTGAAGTVSMVSGINMGSINMSGRTSAMTLNMNSSNVYGNWTFGTGVTTSSTALTPVFSGRGTQAITSNGVTFGCPITVDCFTGTVQLADALTLNSARTLTLTSGTFDAVTYNVTAGTFTGQQFTTLRMGSGTWTLSGNGSVWNLTSSGISNFFKGTANIILSNTGTGGRTFTGGGMSYNKLTIGGATGTSTLSIEGNNQFTELASTKTVAHTIALGTTTQTFGAWTVTGTAGNVVTLTGTGTAHVIAGACTSGIDYLAMGGIGFAATSPGEFYAGANSTATSPAAPLYLTAKPADSTRFWVGGTGNWSDTARWSTSSGGAGGASVPRSHDDVVFNSASNATAYTATVNAVTGGIRCKALTIAGPASGNLTLAGSTAIDGIHGNVTLPATGLVASYSGSVTLSGSATGRTFTTNGQALSTPITVNGVGCGWTLGSAFSASGVTLTVTNGTFDTGNFNVTTGILSSSNSNTRTINLGSSTVTLSSGAGSVVNFATSTDLTFNAGTSSILASGGSANLNGGSGVTFYNVSFTSTAITTATWSGANIFNNVSFAGRVSAGISLVEFSSNQTINGTLTLSAGTNATMRTFLRSDAIGTTRTLTCAAFSGTDADFRDITIAGAAAPVSGTRLGDCKGNSGITFDAPKTVYANSPGNLNWSDISGTRGWSTSIGGTIDVSNFPLAQDTAVIPSSTVPSGSTITINAAYNIGTIDMSARTSNTMTLATGTRSFPVYGNWINGTGTTMDITASGVITFAGRGSQTLTSSGKTFAQGLTINTPGGSLTLQDAFTSISTNSFVHTAGTFNANGFNFTISNNVSAYSVSGSSPRTVAFGSGTWTLNCAGSAFNASTSTNLTVTGTGTISLTFTSAKTFAGGGISYSGITLNQGGSGTLTITGNNTFADISNTFKATGAATITLGTTTQRVGNFTASGEAGRVLTVQGTSASSPATLVFTGAGTATQTTTDYLTITGVRAYSLATTWYAGANSTNNGSLGWIFEATPGGAIAVFIVESATANSTESSLGTFNPTISELANSSDSVASGAVYIGALAESATAADVVAAIKLYLAEIAESATASDLLAASLTFAAAISELTTASDQTAVASRVTSPTIAEAAQMADSAEGGLFFLSSISESAVPADVASAILIFNRAVAESATASEVAVAIAAFRAAVSEEVSGADVANALVTIGGAINEALTALDSVVGPKTTNPTIGETATASEAQTNVYTANPTIAELAQAFDAAQVVASTFSAASAESAVPLDAPQGANTGSSSLSESASGSDSSATAFVASTAVSESTTAEDAAASIAEFNGPIIETATALDESSVAPSVFSAVAAAVAAAFDSQNAPGSVYNATLPTEGVRALDSLIGAYLWNLIDDSQIPDWTGVLNPQNPGWANIGDEQVPNWQNVDNTQAGTWTAVSDDQTPGWVIIPTSRD